jgi:hypothetical protein
MLRVRTALETRAYVRYRSAWLRGFLASVLILVVVALGVMLIKVRIDMAAWLRPQADALFAGARLDEGAVTARLDEFTRLFVLQTALVPVAVLFFAAWLSRVVMNIPALGGGVPNTSPRRAFIYTLIPIVNLWKVPGIVQDAVYRVDPQGGGFFMVLLAWLGLVGSWIAGLVAQFVLGALMIEDLDRATTRMAMWQSFWRSFDLSMGVQVALDLLVAIGSVTLVVVIARVELRSHARDREIRQGAVAAGVGLPAS